MGKPVARIGDNARGICNHGADDCPHMWSGTITNGSDSVLGDGKPVARIGDSISTTCPHCGRGTIVGSSSSVIAGKPVARLGDKITTPAGYGTIIGSGDSVIVA